MKGALSQAAIGRAMNLSPPAITKLKKQGMPVHSLEAALAWRLQHVRLRIPSGLPHTRRIAEPIERLACMWPIGRAAIAEGAFDLVANALRSALAAVPPAARSSVLVDPAVLDALLHAHVGLAMQSTLPGDTNCSGLACQASDEAAAAWYAIAAGEPITSAQFTAIAPGSTP